MDDDELKATSIDMRTPFTEGFGILCELAANYTEITNNKPGNFTEVFFKRIWNDKKMTGQNKEEIFNEVLDKQPDEISKNMELWLINISCAYCIQGLREYAVNKKQPTNLAWAYITEANYWCYLLRNITITNEEMKKVSSKQASHAAKKRYENDKKQQCLQQIKDKIITNRDKFNERGYGAKFIKDMAEQYPEIESYKTFEKLVAKVKKENP